MAPKKERVNLFSGGFLASSATDVSTGQQQQGGQPPPVAKKLEEEEDPLFGNTKRMEELTQKVVSITDGSAYPKIAIELLDDNPYQPRRRMNQKRLESLSREIKAYGFKGVLLARLHPKDAQRYQLVYGHRRREASKLAGLTELPVMIDAISDHEIKFLALNENFLRDDLTPLDEAYAYTSMLEGMSQDAVAERLGVSRGYVRNRIDILKAPEDVQDLVEEKPDTMKAVAYLKDLQEDDIRKIVIQALRNEEITINQIKAFIENLRKEKMKENVVVQPVAQELPQPIPSQPHSTFQQVSQEQTLPKERVSESTSPILTETKPVETILQQSKDQTEATLDKTKIETFTKYLEKYDERLNNRSLTMEERAALDSLIIVAKRIMSNHSA